MLLSRLSSFSFVCGRYSDKLSLRAAGEGGEDIGETKGPISRLDPDNILGLGLALPSVCVIGENGLNV